MTHSHNHRVAGSANLRLDNLLASVLLNLAEEGEQALERASGHTGSATAALLALEEFLGGAHVGRLAEVLGLTHWARSGSLLSWNATDWLRAIRGQIGAESRCGSPRPDSSWRVT
jgi:hypothetical protein